jgi:hypothetical protein
MSGADGTRIALIAGEDLARGALRCALNPFGEYMVLTEDSVDQKTTIVTGNGIATATAIDTAGETDRWTEGLTIVDKMTTTALLRGGTDRDDAHVTEMTDGAVAIEVVAIAPAEMSLETAIRTEIATVTENAEMNLLSRRNGSETTVESGRRHGTLLRHQETYVEPLANVWPLLTL